MYRKPTFGSGVTRATIAAGPAFLLSMMLLVYVGSPDTVAFDAQSPLLIFVAIPAIVFGALLALVPNLIGSALLAYLGTNNVAIRLPVVWALVGGLTAGGAAAIVAIESAAPFAMTGAICALLCRSGTRWP